MIHKNPYIGSHDIDEDWEEKAAIMEFDGNIPREEAEHKAACEVIGKKLGIKLE